MTELADPLDFTIVRVPRARKALFRQDVVQITTSQGPPTT